jgi:hypothetical protein
MGHVGEAASIQRAEFIAESVGGGFIQGAASGAAMGLGIGLVTRAVPGIGPIIGGGMALHGLITRDWAETGATIGKFGQGSDTYETLANTIGSVATVIDVVAQVLDVIAGIVGVVEVAAGVIAAGATVAAFFTFGATLGVAAVAAEVLSTCEEIREGVQAVSGILNEVNSAILRPAETLFRALHEFTTQADPREVEAQGHDLSSAASASGAALGAWAGGHAANIGAHPKPPAEAEPPTQKPPHEAPPPAAGEGPVVKFQEPAAAPNEPSAAPRSAPGEELHITDDQAPAPAAAPGAGEPAPPAPPPAAAPAAPEAAAAAPPPAAPAASEPAAAPAPAAPPAAPDAVAAPAPAAAPVAPDAAAAPPPAAAPVAPDAAAAAAPAAAPPAGGPPVSSGKLEPITAPLELRGFGSPTPPELPAKGQLPLFAPEVEPVPHGLEPGSIGHYDVSPADPHPAALQSNPPGAPGATAAGGRMPPTGRKDAGVYLEHQTPAAAIHEVLPNHEYNGPAPRFRERAGQDTREAPTIALPEAAKPVKDRLDAALLDDVRTRKAAGEDVPPVEVIARGASNAQQATDVPGMNVPQGQISKNFLAEMDWFQRPRYGYEEIRPGEPLGPNHPFNTVTDADLHAHVDNMFAPFEEPRPTPPPSPQMEMQFDRPSPQGPGPVPAAPEGVAPGAAPHPTAPEGTVPLPGSPEGTAPVPGAPEGTAPLPAPPEGPGPVSGSPEGTAPLSGDPDVLNVGEGRSSRSETMPTREQHQDAVDMAVQMGVPRNKVVPSVQGTGYHRGDDVVRIGPDLNPKPVGERPTDVPNPANAALEPRAVIGHEVIGHREAWLAGVSREEGWHEELQASARAAIHTPDLSPEQSWLLLQDAAARRRFQKREGEIYIDTERYGAAAVPETPAPALPGSEPKVVINYEALGISPEQAAAMNAQPSRPIPPTDPIRPAAGQRAEAPASPRAPGAPDVMPIADAPGAASPAPGAPVPGAPAAATPAPAGAPGAAPVAAPGSSAPVPAPGATQEAHGNTSPSTARQIGALFLPQLFGPDGKPQSYAEKQAAFNAQFTADNQPGEGVERISPNYPPPPATPAQIDAIQNEIVNLLAVRGAAEQEADRQQGRADQCVDNQGPIQQTRRDTQSGISAAAAHDAAVARHQATNQQQQQRQQESQGIVSGYPSKVTGITALTLPLAAWEGFTSLASHLPGAAGDKMLQMNQDARQMQDAFAQMGAQMVGIDQGGPAREGALEGDAGRLGATGQAAKASEQRLHTASEGAAGLQQANQAALTEANASRDASTSRADECSDAIDERQTKATTLAQQLQQWAQAHKAARDAAIAATEERLRGEGKKVLPREGQ